MDDKLKKVREKREEVNERLNSALKQKAIKDKEKEKEKENGNGNENRNEN